MTTEQTLPKGWKQYRVSDIGTSMTGSTPSTKKVANYGNYLPFIKPPELNNTRISTSETYLSAEGAKVARILPENSVLISCIGNLGKVGINIKPVAFNQQINAIIPNEIVNPLFLFYQAQSIFFKEQLEKKSSATTISIVNKTSFESIYVYIPPLETQQAIVNKIESLFAEIDVGIGSLKTAVQQLAQYRQSLLKNAFNGELTQAWREENADKLPSRDELLAQIQTAREQHHTQQLADWQSAVSQWEENGKEGKKPSKPKALTQAVKFEEDFADKDGTPYIRIPVGFFIEQPKYGTSQKCEYEKSENSTGVIRIPNITENGLINLEDMKYAEFSAEEKDDYALKKGDLLLIRSNGSVNIVGSVGLVDQEETNYIYAGYLIRLRPIQGIVNSKFLKFAFQSLDVRTQIEFKAKSTSGVNNINAQEVQDLKVNIFSLAEQTQIVAILENKLTACDRLATDLTAQLKQAELLKQSVLKAAFSGKLGA